MKNSIFIALAFIAATSITNQLLAQESVAKTATYDLKKNVKCRVSTTETGCFIEFENSTPSDAFSSKKGYDYYQAKSSFNVSAVDNSISEVSSPRDAASGLATGRRMHKPMIITKEIDKSSPKLLESVSSSGTISEASAVKGAGSGAGKVNVQDLSFTKRCAGKSSNISCDGGDCEIPIGDCPNGDCNLTASWSWGASQSGSSNRCSVNFLLKIEDGVCTAMAINEKGLPGEKKPTKSSSNNPK